MVAGWAVGLMEDLRDGSFLDGGRRENPRADQAAALDLASLDETLGAVTRQKTRANADP